MSPLPLDALPRAKRAAVAAGPLSGDAAAAAVAANLGVSRAAAERALQTVFPAPSSAGKIGAAPLSDQAVTTLAAALHLSISEAGSIWNALNRMSDPGPGVDPDSPAFAALASRLGRTPANSLKRSMRGNADWPRPALQQQAPRTGPAAKRIRDRTAEPPMFEPGYEWRLPGADGTCGPTRSAGRA